MDAGADAGGAKSKSFDSSVMLASFAVSGANVVGESVMSDDAEPGESVGAGLGGSVGKALLEGLEDGWYSGVGALDTVGGAVGMGVDSVGFKVGGAKGGKVNCIVGVLLVSDGGDELLIGVLFPVSGPADAFCKTVKA
jgi:hypothetical protein